MNQKILFFSAFLVLIFAFGCVSQPTAQPQQVAPAQNTPVVETAPAQIQENGMDEKIQEILNSSLYANARWGLLFVDADTGEVLYALNENEMFRAASTAKCYSVAAALDTLGPDYRFETPVFADGNIQNGTLKGNLVLVASGDLTFGGRSVEKGKLEFTNADHTEVNTIPWATLPKGDSLAGLDELARQVKEAGIIRVGNVVVDDRLFDKTPAESREYLLTPIMVNDNVIDVLIEPKGVGEKAEIEMIPANKIYEIESGVITVAAGEGTGVEISTEGNTIVLSGQIEEGKTDFFKAAEVEDPSAFARSLFIEALIKRGIEVGTPETGTNPEGELPAKEEYASMQRVALFTSPPLIENAKVILKPSQNLHSETLLLLMAAHSGGTTAEEGMQMEKEFLMKATDVNGISLATGRGSSVADLTTPNSMVKFLVYMQGKPYFGEFYDAFPIMGVDGSLVDGVPQESPIRGKVYGKTGTVASGDLLNSRMIVNVKGLAGYMETQSGRKVAYAMYVENVPANAIEDLNKLIVDQGKICEAVYKEN
jgi:D-alanyl-D-alanine carboxypeptidase/D-alanyl-D-alanine-endopeptidase (penicillin-binding protein 4)